MKVRELIEALQQQNQNAEAVARIAVEIGDHLCTRDFVLIKVIGQDRSKQHHPRVTIEGAFEE